MLHKILVHAAVSAGHFLVHNALHVLAFVWRSGLPLLEYQNIRHHFGARVALKCRVRQAYSAQKVGFLHHVLAHAAALGVHGVVAGDEHQQAAGPHLVNGLGKEIVMDGARHRPGIGVIHNGEVAKGHVANGHVYDVVADLRVFKPFHAHIRVGVQLFRDPAGDAVQFHHRPAAHLLLHVRGHGPDKMANAAAGLQHPASLEAQMPQSIVHGAYYFYARIVRVHRAGPGRVVFVAGQQIHQLCIFFCPLGVVLVKGLGNAAPAHIFAQDVLFVRRGIAVLRFQRFQQADGFHVGLVPGFLAIGQIQRVPDAVIGALGRLRLQLLLGFFHRLRKLFFRGLVGFVRYFSGFRSYMISFTYSLASFSYRP